MALLLKKMVQYYLHFNDKLADPRTQHYPLVSSPITLIALLCLYQYFVLSWGPKFMKNRKPYNIDKILIVFNIVQIVACAFLVLQFHRYCFFQFNWSCEPLDYSNEEIPLKYAFYTWIYFVIKILDLLDTVFFVLRKRFNQITFLHVYHHTGMVIMMWIGCKYIAGGHGLFIGYANCIVHVFMYLYYLMSVWDEKYKKSIWWKKYITQLQMGQFLFLLIILGQTLFQPQCTYPKWAVILFLPQNTFMFVLFGDFYYKTYIKEKPDRTKQQQPKKEQLIDQSNKTN